MSFFIFSYGGINYELSQAEWLWLYPLIIIAAITLRFINSKYLSQSNSVHLADISTHQELKHPLFTLLSNSKEKTHASPSFNIFYYLVLFLLVLALSQPVKIGEKLPDPPQKRDIVFIVDTSVSMILRDYILNGNRIDRMSLLKGVLDDFIVKLKGERMSIIIFGDNAYTLVPLTSDQHLLRRMLERVQATMAGRFNAIGEAIALAVKQALNSDKDKSKRILVLLTDADQPTGDIEPIAAAKLAKAAKLPLYTIAIGATNIAADENRLAGLLYSPVDLVLTQQLSSITGAKSFQAGDVNALKNAIQEINVHGTNNQKTESIYYRESLYYWPLIIAFIIFSLSQLIALIKARLIKSQNASMSSQANK